MGDTKKRILSFVFALLLAISCNVMALAAEDGTAVTMKLAKTEGTVGVSAGSGKKVSVRKDMRLYNGYGMETRDESYAWVSLDNRRMVKLDAASEASVRKKGKKLEILLDSGNIFFNVAKPLEDDESFFIRTSTTAIGIRGTCGLVEVTDERTVNVILLEGTVHLTVRDPVTGQTKTETVTGGERVTCLVYEPEKAGDKCDILREHCTKQDVPGFALTELVPDSPLVEKIYGESGIDLRDVTPEAATKRLREDEGQTARKLAQIEDALEKQPGGGASVWGGSGSAPFQPQGEQPAPPGSEQPAQPGSEQPAQPGGEQPTQPGGEQPTRPGDEQPSQPGGEQPAPPDDGQPAQPVTHTVIFDGNGGSLSGRGAITVTVEKGKPVADPGAPARSGYVFRGWFTDRTYTRAWDFERDTVVRDIQLYARWEEAPRAVTYTVTFDGNGGTLSGPGTVTVEQGQPVARPADPVRSGHVFAGWFAPGATEEWDFIRPVGRDMTFTARWDPMTRLAAIQELLDNNQPVTVDETFIIDGTLKVPAGAVLTFREQVRVADTGNVTVNGTMNAEQGLTNQGQITVNSTNTLNVAGELKTEGSGTLAITRSGKVMADTLTGSVELEPGAQVFCKNKRALDDQISFSPDFTISPKKWSTKLYGDGYYRLEHIAWKADGEIVTICGIGDMPNYSIYGAPWKDQSIKTAVIQAGVSSIGQNAFKDWSSLSSVSIPESVTSMGESAFSGCRSLSSVSIPAGISRISGNAFAHCSSLTGALTIPAGVSSIGDYAFSGCSGLSNVSIPAGVSSIGRGAFENCSGLSSVSIPSSVTSIGNWAFSGCSSLTGFAVGAENQLYSSEGGVLFNKDKTTLVRCPQTMSGSYTIPTGVMSIGYSAFSGCSGLSSVSIPSSVTSIGGYAFSDCSGLSSVSIPSSVMSIGDSAFSGCSRLTVVKYAGTRAQWAQITTGNDNDPLNNVKCTE